jgi:hypothetical protein
VREAFERGDFVVGIDLWEVRRTGSGLGAGKGIGDERAAVHEQLRCLTMEGCKAMHG